MVSSSIPESELILSICIGATFVMSLAFCLCWKKKAPKNELLGLDGMVTPKNPDENVNHLPSAAPMIESTVSANVDVNDSLKRSVPAGNTRRSLPDIPLEPGTLPANWEPCDNSSEHYATVGQYQNGKHHSVPNGIEITVSKAQHGSISQADNRFPPYEKLNYSRVKLEEHPYAQLQPTTSRQAVQEESSLIAEEGLSLLRPEISNTSSDPLPPPRSRRSSASSTLGVDIPAGTAVAGGIAASPELPYMTPRVIQPNFSGDSQDSSKGYTSITVREPLANLIKEQRKEPNNYYTVSDDSDDVYTTIPDPNSQIYTSESETYARIPPHPITVEAEVNLLPSESLEENDEWYEPLPHSLFPNVDSLKQAPGPSHSHSRQASSSSSIANVGSPKPEKRQANSPLPPPPTGPLFDFHADKRNIDDLYAKVQKNKKKGESDGERTPEKIKRSMDNVSRQSISSCSSSEERNRVAPLQTPPAAKKNYTSDMNLKDHNYETLRKTRDAANDPNYEKIPQDEPGYASINDPESICSSDPGYEVLKQRVPSEADPNYEELRHRSSNASDCAGYSKINYATKQNKSEDKSSSFGSLSTDEPNYESMPSESISSDPNYSGLKSTGSESDPNYESVRDLEEPPYERLNDGDSSKAELSGGRYENLDTSDSSNGEPRRSLAYEQLNDTDSEAPGYEKIRKGGDSTESGGSDKGNGSNLLDEDGIYQV